MKRAISQRTRRGSPPLPRQRKALRVVQLTFLAMGAALLYLAIASWAGSSETPSVMDTPPRSSIWQFVFFAVAGVASIAAAASMGFKTVRGPRPPDIG